MYQVFLFFLHCSIVWTRKDEVLASRDRFSCQTLMIINSALLWSTLFDLCTVSNGVLMSQSTVISPRSLQCVIRGWINDLSCTISFKFGLCILWGTHGCRSGGVECLRYCNLMWKILYIHLLIASLIWSGSYVDRSLTDLVHAIMGCKWYGV